jgi:hypothetical protein
MQLFDESETMKPSKTEGVLVKRIDTPLGLSKVALVPVPLFDEPVEPLPAMCVKTLVVVGFQRKTLLLPLETMTY